MRKFITIGLSTLATASLAMGVAAGPANAVVSTVLTDTVCASLPAQLLAGNAGLLAAQLVQSNAVTAEAAAESAFGDAQLGFADAVVEYVKAVDAGTPLGGKTATVYDTLGVYSAKFAAWSTADAALDAADKGVEVANVNNTILSRLSTGLVC